MTEQAVPAHERRHIGWLLLIGLLVLWVVAELAGSLAASLISASETDDFTKVGASLAHNALPAVFGIVLIAVVISWLKWWPVVMRDERRARTWAWVFPVGLVVAALITMSWSRISHSGLMLTLSLAVSVLCIAISEELTFRGLVLRAMRDKYSEFWAALITTFLFGAAHMLSGGFGNIGQGLFTFLAGYLFYVTRRVSGSIIAAILVHALWDFAVFSNGLGVGSSSASTLFGGSMLVLLLFVVALASYKAWQRPLQASE